MSWTKLDDMMLQNPKIAAVGGVGFAVHVAGIVYCGQNLTDGFVPYGVGRGLLNLDGLGFVNGQAGRDAECIVVIREGVPGYVSLECAGLWAWDDERRGWWIHDYLSYNPSREQVEAERDSARSRMQKLRGNLPPRSEDVQPNNRRSSATPVPVPEVPSEPKREQSGPRRKRPLTSVPDVLELTNDQIEWVQHELPDLDYAVATQEWVTACRAKDLRYADWGAAWKNAMRRAVRWQKAGPGRTHL